MEETLTPDHALALAQAVPFLLDFPASRFWVDYDQEADVLYISFARLHIANLRNNRKKTLQTYRTTVKKQCNLTGRAAMARYISVYP